MTSSNERRGYQIRQNIDGVQRITISVAMETDATQQASALARWDNEGGAAKSLTHERPTGASAARNLTSDVPS